MAACGTSPFCFISHVHHFNLCAIVSDVDNYREHNWKKKTKKSCWFFKYNHRLISLRKKAFLVKINQMSSLAWVQSLIIVYLRLNDSFRNIKLKHFVTSFPRNGKIIVIFCLKKKIKILSLLYTNHSMQMTFDTFRVQYINFWFYFPA